MADPTFSTSSASQAQQYAATRGSSYPVELYKTILDFHNTGSGPNISSVFALDVGCGPGNATRDLAMYFDRVIGVDPSAEMVNAARKKLQQLEEPWKDVGERVTYQVSGSEGVDTLEGVTEGSIDVITAAMAAHWFDHPAFYQAAFKVLKPRGTIALWTVSSFYCHPTRTPNAALVQSILSNLEDNLLAPYELSGNRLSRLGYATLPLPWDSEPDSSGNESDSDSGFDQSSFIRKVWDENGILSSGPSGDFFAGTKTQKLDDLEKSLGSASMVIRWREANPELVGTEEDVIRVTMKRLREAMGDVDELEASGSFALIMFKKKAYWA